jgi:catechol 2,3-dioxygenase-like lactoylglutathione lyase family enzyme
MQTMQAIKVRDVYGTLPAADIDRAKRWYEQKLGWRPVMERSDGLMYEVGDSHVLIYPSSHAGTNRATALTLSVDDVRRTADELRGNGVVLEQFDMPNISWENGLARAKDGSMLGGWIKDSEGNLIGFGKFER